MQNNGLYGCYYGFRAIILHTLGFRYTLGCRCLARPANGNRSRSFRLIIWLNLKPRLCRLRALSLQSETQTMSIETATVGYNGSLNSWFTHLHGPSAFERGGSISTGMSCRRSLRLSWVRVWGFADSDLSCNVGGRGFGIGVLASK